MNDTMHLWEFFLITFSGWMNQHQERVIDYLIEETGSGKESSAARGFDLRIMNGEDLP